MASKRSRAAFEDDLKKKQSPYALYGTPLPPLDPEVRDDGSFVPVWQQEVRDERGRKRFHGAFTGGYSAGYFNTVGSKEGWAPQAFVSSRTNRAKAQQRAEDFMDEEDIADAEEAQQLQTAGNFSGLGSTADEASRRDAFIGLIRPEGETMGVKLLQRMGWRAGQGVGPKVRRKARLAEEGGFNVEDEGTHLFAPENSKMIGFVKKNDFKGLGYADEASLSRLAGSAAEEKQDGDEDANLVAFTRPKLIKAKSKPKKGAFGVGILNDTGSDEEDPYEMGPKISYNRTIGGDKKAKKNGAAKGLGGSANPLLGARPVFMSKKVIAKISAPGFKKCHDGRLPLNGFILSTKSTDATPANRYPLPTIPEGWQSAKIPSTAAAKPSDWQSTSDAAKASQLDPKTRAAMLGEAALPGKSVFDFLSPAARDRLAAASGRTDLPAALGEAPPEGHRTSDADKQKQLWSLVPSLDKDLAVAALQRGVSGWMPYAEDEGKRARYRAFLELRAGLRDVLPERKAGFTSDDWKNELSEFAQAAQVFRPMSGMMASRFTSSSRTFEGSFNPGGKESDMPLLTKSTAKPEDPAEAAAKMGMYGPMTRSTLPFYPTRLLCKRFNVKPPSNVQIDPGSDVGGEKASSSSVPEVVSKSAIEQMLQEAAARRFTSGGTEGGTPGETPHTQPSVQLTKEAIVDVEKNDALEGERPGDAVFKAIFGSDSEDDDDI